MKVIAFFLLCSLAAFAGITPGNADNVRRAGDTMSGTLDMGGNAISNLATCTEATEAANKAYVDAATNAMTQWHLAQGPGQSAVAAPLGILVGNAQNAAQITWQDWYTPIIDTVTVRQTLALLPFAEKNWTNTLIIRCSDNDGSYWSNTKTDIIPLHATRAIVTQLLHTSICSQNVFAVTYSANVLASGITGYTTRVEYKFTRQ